MPDDAAPEGAASPAAPPPVEVLVLDVHHWAVGVLSMYRDADLRKAAEAARRLNEVTHTLATVLGVAAALAGDAPEWVTILDQPTPTDSEGRRPDPRAN